MKERPILFSGAMVRAILDGRKTQTRRLVRAPAGRTLIEFRDGVPRFVDEDEVGEPEPFEATSPVCPYGVPGDRLWVKETHQVFTVGDDVGIAYRATCAPDGSFNYVHGDEVVNIRPESWRPSIHMKRAWSRLTLQVEAVRVERLQSAKLADLRAEGMSSADYEKCLASFTGAEYQREWWRTLWDSINGERAPYASNPWVWVVEFHVVQAAARAA